MRKFGNIFMIASSHFIRVTEAAPTIALRLLVQCDCPPRCARLANFVRAVVAGGVW
jgi:hypothetical protein